MSGFDPVARGLAARALARTSLLAASATPVTLTNVETAATSYPVATIPLEPGAFAPNAVIEIAALFSFPLPNNAGRAVFVRIGTTTLAQAFPVATIGGLEFTTRLHVGPDGKSIAVLSQSANGVLSPTAGQGEPFRAQTSPAAVLAIDCTVAQTLTLSVSPSNGDTVTLHGFTVVRHARPTPVNTAPPRAVAVCGHSLVQGSGDSISGGWPTRLRQLDPGRPVFNGGIGGQGAVQIVDRLRADRVRGRHWTVILDLARNEVGSPTMLADVMAQIDRAKAALAPGVALIVATCTPAAGETATSANGLAIAAFNGALRARGDIAVLDTFAALVDQPDGTISAARMADGVHWNAVGHALVAGAAKTLLVGRAL